MSLLYILKTWSLLQADIGMLTATFEKSAANFSLVAACPPMFCVKYICERKLLKLVGFGAFLARVLLPVAGLALTPFAIFIFNFTTTQ